MKNIEIMSGAEVPVLLIAASSVIGSVTFLTRSIRKAKCGNCCECHQDTQSLDGARPEMHDPPSHPAVEQAIKQTEKITLSDRVKRALTPRRIKRTPRPPPPPPPEEDTPPLESMETIELDENILSTSTS